MKHFKFLAWLVAFIFITATGAWALSEFNDEVINGVWTFEQELRLNKSITLNGTTYTSLSPSAWDDLTSPDANKTHAFTTYTSTFTGTSTVADQWNFQGLGNFGDVSIMRIEQKTGNPTNGTVLEVISADTDVDPLVVTTAGSTPLQIYGGGNVAIDGAVGTVTYTDWAFSADGALGIYCDLGGTMITLEPSAAAIGIDASDTDITTALNVGANDIVGTTGLINYTNFDVLANGSIVSAGNLTAVDGTFSGNVHITGTFQQDNITAATAATTLNVNGTGVGGVTIGGTSTGVITLGGGATEVNLPSTVDFVMAGGDLTATDTANADMVTFTNNTMTTADLVTLSASGTRTSDNIIEIIDGATTASTIGITANAQTVGNGISYTNTGAGLTGSAIYLAVTDGAGFTGNYINAFDGAASDFKVARYGATTIAGLASTDMFTVSAGDIKLTTGDVRLLDGILTITNDADEANLITRDFAGAGTGPVLTITDDNTASTNTALAVKQDGTAASTGVSITHSGDNPSLNIVAGAARTGDVIAIPMANQLNQRAIDITGAITSVAGGGTIEVHATGVIPATASLLRLDADTAQPGDGDGYMMNIDDDTLVVATPSKYAVLIDSNANEALHVATGKTLFDEAATFTAGIVATGDIDIDFNQTTEEMVVSQSGEVSGAGGAIVTLESTLADVTTQGYVLKLQVADDADVDADYLACINDSDGTPDIVFTVSENGNVLTEGTLTVNGAQIIGDGATQMVGVTHPVVDGGAGGTYTVTAAMSGTIFTNSQAVEFDLPADPTGLEFTFVVANASNLHLDPNVNDIFVHSTCAAGDRILAATVGYTVTIVGVSSSAWNIKSMYPASTSWTDAD